MGTAAQTDLQSLSSALQTGNLTTAQQAFAQLQQDDPQLANMLAAGATASGTAAAS